MRARRGTGDGEKETITIRKAFKKLIKKHFERRWIEKFLDNWDRCIEICLNSIFYGIDHIYNYKNLKKEILHI